MVSKNPGYREIFEAHSGKLSDKWSLYLDVYQEFLEPRRKDIKHMLEIGVQNGGSLAIWAKYFPEAESIIGIDIEPKCALLTYPDYRIKVLIGDAGSRGFLKENSKELEALDFILDDGSHRSDHIIQAFVALFPRLRPGGAYIIEDLHASYWPEYQGGLKEADSSLNFLKRLIDVANSDHWLEKSKISNYLENVHTEITEDFIESIMEIRKITFSDSLCIVEKGLNHEESRLGRRIVRGDVASVMPEVALLDGDLCKKPTQNSQTGETVNRVTPEWLATKIGKSLRRLTKSSGQS